ncbi:hypothetical protein B4168_2244 [Anoxybacillus flavithermus]|nr:hypothetical protein B4168_2244 [Anoxybacillus flavithermus]
MPVGIRQCEHWHWLAGLSKRLSVFRGQTLCAILAFSAYTATKERRS